MSTPAVLAITEPCPACGGTGKLHELDRSPLMYVVVCEVCRTYVYRECASITLAVEAWNSRTEKAADSDTVRPKWRALLSDEDERETQIKSESRASDPDLTMYEEYVHQKPIPVDNSKTAPVAQSVDKKA